MAKDEEIHLGTLAPMVGLSAGDEPDYLDYDFTLYQYHLL